MRFGLEKLAIKNVAWGTPRTGFFSMSQNCEKSYKKINTRKDLIQNLPGSQPYALPIQVIALSYSMGSMHVWYGEAQLTQRKYI